MSHEMLVFIYICICTLELVLLGVDQDLLIRNIEKRVLNVGNSKN